MSATGGFLFQRSKKNSFAFTSLNLGGNQTTFRSTKRSTHQGSMQYEWPLQKKDASIEEQLCSTWQVKAKIPKTEMKLNTVIEASKSIRNAAR